MMPFSPYLLKISTLVLLVVLLAGSAVGKFNSSNLVVTGFTANYATYILFWQNQIVVGLDINEGAFVNSNASVALYSAQGVLLNRYYLPTYCTVIPCYTSTSYVAIQGSVLTVLSQSNGYPFNGTTLYISLDLSTGNIIRTATPSLLTTSYEFLQITNNTVLVSYQSSAEKNYYSVLYLNNLTIAHNFSASPFYLMDLSNSIVAVDGTAYICAVNPSTFALVYKEVKITPTIFNVTNSTTNNTCGNSGSNAISYDAGHQQILILLNQQGNLDISFVSTAGGHLQLYPSPLTLVQNDGLAQTIANTNTYAITSFRFVNNQTYGYIDQVAIQPGSGVLKDRLLIPPPFYVSGDETVSAVNAATNVYVTTLTTNYGVCGPALFIATYDDN